MTFECDVVGESDIPAEALVVTINPFVPSKYLADSFSAEGAFPTMTLLRLLGDKGFMDFVADRGEAISAVELIWPAARMLFQYYLHGNWPLFEKTAEKKFGLKHVGSTGHERTTVAYQSLTIVTESILGRHGQRGARVVDRFGRKHVAALKTRSYIEAVRMRGALEDQLERDIFTAISGFVEHREAWEMGSLGRFVEPEKRPDLDDLVLYRDEFSIVRDLYQQGFELACKCLWMLAAAQNAVKRGVPGDFGDDHPDTVPEKRRAKSLAQFDKLPNAFKVAYVAQVPGWDSLAELLNSRRRKTIGHASTHHDLRTGRIVSNQDLNGITYLDFLGETLGVFEAMSSLTQVLRAARIAVSPDFL